MKKVFGFLKWILLGLIGGSTTLPLYGQGNAPELPFYLKQDFLNQVLAIVAFLYVLLLMRHLMVLEKLAREVGRMMLPQEEAAKLAEEPSIWQKILKHLSGLKPLEAEKDLVLEGHEYDGIKELSNGMPPWLRYLFLGTILFGVVYFTYFTMLGIGPTQEEEYAQEMARAALQKEERMKLAANKVDENTVVVLTEKNYLEEGRKIFIENCATCHGENGGGGAGPNLTDEYWLHGGGVKNIFKLVKYGFIQKGMPPWEDKLTPFQIQKVTSYVLSLQGSNPPGGLPPAGEKWTETPPDTSTLKTTTASLSSLDAAAQRQISQ
ncbi:MAG: c-type cytochrome [Flavobacteriales bacterium]|nr:c-type cytochrome [Flavobacteriales bacterium]